MLKRMLAASSLGLCCLVTACAEVPDNPSVDVMPMPGQSYQDFQMQRDFCVKEARSRVKRTANRANTRGIVGGVVTGVLGAGIGAAAGGAGGAAIGGAAGALGGAAGGALYSGSSDGTIQNAYNIGYLQCMQASRNGGYAMPRSPAYGQSPYGQSSYQAPAYPPQGMNTPYYQAGGQYYQNGLN